MYTTLSTVLLTSHFYKRESHWDNNESISSTLASVKAHDLLKCNNVFSSCSLLALLRLASHQCTTDNNIPISARAPISGWMP